MSDFLFNRTKKPFVSTSDSDDDEPIPSNLGKDRKRKSEPIQDRSKVIRNKKETVEIDLLDDSDTDKVEETVKDNSTSAIASRAKAEFEMLLQNSGRSESFTVSKVNHVPSSSNSEDKEIAEAAKALLVNLSNSRQSLYRSEIQHKTPSNQVPQSSNKFVVPTVKSAKEAESSAKPFSVDRIERLLGHAGSSGGLSSKAVEEPSVGERIKLKTRLNGKHEHIWKFGMGDHFGKLIDKFALRYELQKNSFKLVFDGEPIKDKDTPQSIGLEDEDLIDVTVDGKLFDNAIKSCENYKSRK